MGGGAGYVVWAGFEASSYSLRREVSLGHTLIPQPVVGAGEVCPDPMVGVWAGWTPHRKVLPLEDSGLATGQPVEVGGAPWFWPRA